MLEAGGDHAYVSALCTVGGVPPFSMRREATRPLFNSTKYILVRIYIYIRVGVPAVGVPLLRRYPGACALRV